MSQVVVTKETDAGKFELVEGCNGFYVYLNDEFVHCLGPIEDLSDNPTREDYETHLLAFIEYWQESQE